MSAHRHLPRSGPGPWVERAHEVLREQFRRAGVGSIRRVEKKLGIAAGSFRKWRRRGRLDLRVLYRALAELGVEPNRFWVEVVGADFDPVLVASRPTGPPTDLAVRRAVARWESRSPGPSRRLDDEELRQLDALRDRDSKRAVRQASKALAAAVKDQIPYLLAVYGSARRVEARLDKALEALRYALELAERGGAKREDRADLLRRLGVAIAFTGDLSLGLLFAREAEHQYKLAGDLRGEGRTLVDQGTRYSHLGQLDEAIAAYNAALRCLPEDEAAHRFAACQSLAVAHHRQGSSRKALDYAGRAEALAPKVGLGLQALLLATKAEIVTAEGNLAEAEQCYAAELEIYKVLSPIDAALVAIDLVRTQLVAGRVGPALETIKGMGALLESLKNNQLASEAIRYLFRTALTGGRITARVLDRVARAIEKSRARRGCHARAGD